MSLPIPELMVAVDLETTGLHPFFSQICEVGAVAFEVVTGSIVGEFASLINPMIPIPDSVTAIHGITNAMVAGAPPFGEVFDTLHGFLAPYPVFVGHNITFDFNFLRHRATQLRKPLDVLGTIDTVHMARWAFQGFKSYKLTNLTDVLGIAHTDAHRALQDAEAARQLFVQAFAQLQQAGNSPDAIFGRILKPIPEEFPTPKDTFSPEMARLYKACENCQRLVITYHNAQQEICRRVIDPLGMQMLGGEHYVVAWCHYKDANRNFRVDRIVEWEAVGEVPLADLLREQGLIGGGRSSIADSTIDVPIEDETSEGIGMDPPVEVF